MFSRQDLPDRPTKAHRSATRLWQRIGAVHHQSALRALLFAVPVALSPVLAPVQASAQSLTLCPGDVVVPQGTPCPTPTTAPLLTISSCTGASVIIQRCALDASSGPGFGQTLQNQAVAQLLNAYQLPPTDGARILDSERSLVRGVMFNTLLQMVTKNPRDRSATEQTTVENLTKLVQQKRVHAAQAAITEYNKWAAYPCGYAPPGTYTYTPGTNCGVPGGLGGLFTTTPPPSFNSFQAYGAYLAYQSIVDDPSFQSAQWGTAQAILLGATVPAAIGAGAAATAFTTALYAGGVSVSPILTAATTATDVAIGAEVGAFTVGAALAVVLIAIVIGVFHVYDTVTDADIPTYLNNALNVASSTPVDLPTVITTDAGMQEVFTVFLGTTLPDYPALQPVPAPQSSDRKFFLQADGAASATSSPTLAYKAWDGSTHKARLNGGWFVDTDAAGKSKVALEIGYVQSDGTHWTAWRVGDRFLHTAVTNPLDTPVLDDQVHLLNPAGMAYHVSLSLQPGVWSLGTGGSSGDGSVSTYNSTTTGWTGVDGLAKRVAVGGDGQPWAINSKGDVFRRNGFVCVNGGPQATHAGYVDGEWQLRLGANASAIGVGADGSVWIIDTTPGPKGKGNGVERRMYQATDQMDILGTWNRDVWKKMVGPEGVAIAVGPDGQPWVVNSEGVVWSGVKGGATNSYIDGSFQAVPNGRARDIAVGGDGSVWVIGTDRVDGGSSIWKYGGSGTWQHVSGAGSRIAVDGLGNPWVVNDLGVLWRYDIASSQWHVMSAPGSITAIAVGGLSAGPASPSVPGMTPLPCAPDLVGPGF